MKQKLFRTANFSGRGIGHFALTFVSQLFVLALPLMLVAFPSLGLAQIGSTRGTTDIALIGPSGWNTAPVASSRGDGSFQVTNRFIGNFASWASDPLAAKLTGDFNGDGWKDIALTGPAGWNTLPVAFSNGDGTFTVTNHQVGAFASWASDPRSVKLTGDFN
jgi:hypothetical protein